MIEKFVPQFLLNGYRNYRKKLKIQSHLRSIQGDRVVCPICNSTFNEFGPFGLVSRKNARCYNCDSLERHRLLWVYLNQKTDLFKAKQKIRLLHFAPEKMYFTIFSVAPNIEYYPCDLSPEACKFEGKANIQKADITDIPFEDNYFDMIICSHVLEHIPKDALAMSELCRVLKTDGSAFLQVPVDYNQEITYEDFSIISPEGRKRAFGQSDHVRLYGCDFKDRLSQAGFMVEEIDFAKSFSSEDIFRYGFLNSGNIYHCGK